MPRPSRRDEILRAAIALLDEDGLDGLTMRRLSDRTGASATSVYWYVSSREELVATCLDDAFGEVALPELASLGWRDAAAAIARDLRAVFVRHPWIVAAAATHPTAYGPRLAALNEHMLTVYEAAGFDPEAADDALATVLAFVLGSSLGSAPSGEGGDGDGGDLFARARREAEGLPRLSARLQALASADLDAEGERAFEFGLSAVLDGLAARAT